MDIRLMNLGSDQEYPLAEIADKIIRLTGSSSRVRFEPTHGPSVEAGLRISQAKHALRWVPLVGLKMGFIK